MNMWVRNNEILRQTPRYNPDVNDYWMCDYGRLNTFRHVHAETRIKGPIMKKENGPVEVGWDEAIALVASEFKGFKKSEIAVIGSAFATNEDNFVAQKFARDVLGTRYIDFLRHEVEGDEDELLIRADKTPNSRGAAEVGVHPANSVSGLEGILRGIKEGQIKALYVIEDNVGTDPVMAQHLSRLDYLVVHSSVENETTRLADVVFPTSTHAEKNGTYVNFQGRVQRIRPAVATLEQDRATDGFSMSRLDKFGSPFDRWAKGAKIDARPTWRIVAGIASLMGVKYRYTKAEDVFNEMASTLEAFKGMSYRKLGVRGISLGPSKVSAPASPANVSR
jgi:NADH-quinone oxidoreductase subunit G